MDACLQRRDLGLYSRPKEFAGNGVRTHINSKGKIVSTRRLLGGLNSGCRIVTPTHNRLSFPAQ